MYNTYYSIVNTLRHLIIFAIARLWKKMSVYIYILHLHFTFVKWETVPDVQGGFRKGRGTRNKIANIHWIIEKATDFQ